EQAAFALAARLLEDLAGLPEGDDAPDLFLRLGLAADVFELDAPFGIARLERLDLHDSHREQRPHEEQHVGDEEEEDLEEQGEVSRAEEVREPDPPRCGGAGPLDRVDGIAPPPVDEVLEREEE